MKVIALLSLIGVVSAFAPAQVGRAATAQNALFDDVSNNFLNLGLCMDL